MQHVRCVKKLCKRYTLVSRCCRIRIDTTTELLLFFSFFSFSWDFSHERVTYRCLYGDASSQRTSHFDHRVLCNSDFTRPDLLESTRLIKRDEVGVTQKERFVHLRIVTNFVEVRLEHKSTVALVPELLCDDDVMNTEHVSMIMVLSHVWRDSCGVIRSTCSDDEACQLISMHMKANVTQMRSIIHTIVHNPWVVKLIRTVAWLGHRNDRRQVDDFHLLQNEGGIAIIHACVWWWTEGILEACFGEVFCRERRAPRLRGERFD